MSSIQAKKGKSAGILDYYQAMCCVRVSKEYNDMYMAGIVMGYRLNARWLVNKDVAYGSCDLMIT